MFVIYDRNPFKLKTNTSKGYFQQKILVQIPKDTQFLIFAWVMASAISQLSAYFYYWQNILQYKTAYESHRFQKNL